VYIAYGRDAQAEEILKEALRTQPERHAVRIKLLEIYVSRKDLRAFETLASELYELTRGEGEDWAQAVHLGKSIDPANPLYLADKGSGDAFKASVPVAEQGSGLEDSNLDGLFAVTSPQAPSSVPDVDAVSTPVEELSAEPEPAVAQAAELEFKPESMGVSPESAQSIASSQSSQVPQDMLHDINFDFMEEFKPAVAEAPAVAASTPMMEEISMTTPAAADMLESPVGEVSAAPTGKPEALEFDLSDLSLDLPVAEDVSVTEPEADDDSKSAEMATKLDLALAYQEIGDKEGARELLKEVAQDGTAEQAHQAQDLLLKLG